MLKKLVEAGAGVCARDDKGNTCLHFAASRGHTETVRYLVGLKRMDVDHVNNDGNTALHLAVRCNHADVVKLLVGAGAGVGIPDSTGNTSLMYAAFYGHTETVRYLVGVEGVEVDKSHSMRGYTALHLAVQQKHADVVQVFIDAGAAVEAKDDSGSTPLHVASSSGSLHLVKLLIEAGAGVRVTNGAGATCLLSAASHGHTETVRYLVGVEGVEVDHTDINVCVVTCSSTPVCRCGAGAHCCRCLEASFANCDLFCSFSLSTFAGSYSRRRVNWVYSSYPYPFPGVIHEYNFGD